MDKVGKEFWNSSWYNVSESFNLKGKFANKYIKKKFDGLFKAIFNKVAIPGKMLLELGCANSETLPYFAASFGFQVNGIDYSEIGCRQAQQQLKTKGIEGNIICCDFFDPSLQLNEVYDVVFSNGVAEHFENTSEFIRRAASFLKPGGIIVTIIPNITGIIGCVQKFLNRKVFDMHMPLDKDKLATFHRSNGLEVLSNHYFLTTNFGICNLEGLKKNSPSYIFKRLLVKALRAISLLLFWVDSKIQWSFNSNKLFSSYVICVARKDL